MNTDPKLKRMLGGAAYFITGLGRFSELEPVDVHLRGPDLDWQGKILVLAVGNARQAGGGHVLCPDAVLNDGLLDVAILPDVPEGEQAHAIRELMTKGLQAVKDAALFWRVPSLEIDAPNGLYVNLRGRDKNGIVSAGEREALMQEIADGLLEVVDPDTGLQAITRVYQREKFFKDRGNIEHGPDIVVGYHRGWRGSNESALGRIPPVVFEDNLLKWSGDHCIAADEVPGVLLANRPLLRENPALVDLAPTILKLFGVTPPPEMVGGDVFSPR